MRTSLVKFTPDAIKQAVADTEDRKRIICVPGDECPLGLNDINVVAYTVLKNALFELKPKELQFVAQMARTSSITARQRKWLKSIAIVYVGVDIDAAPVSNVVPFTA